MVLKWPKPSNISLLSSSKRWFLLNRFLFPNKDDPSNLLAYKNSILFYAKSDHFWSNIRCIYLRETYFGFKVIDTKLEQDPDLQKLPSSRHRRFFIPLYGSHNLKDYKIVFIVRDGREWKAAELDSKEGKDRELHDSGMLDWLNYELPK